MFPAYYYSSYGNKFYLAVLLWLLPLLEEERLHRKLTMVPLYGCKVLPGLTLLFIAKPGRVYCIPIVT